MRTAARAGRGVEERAHQASNTVGEMNPKSENEPNG